MRVINYYKLYKIDSNFISERSKNKQNNFIYKTKIIAHFFHYLYYSDIFLILQHLCNIFKLMNYKLFITNT